MSPANKRQPGLDVYIARRADILEAGAHLMEIDLVRAGNWQSLRTHICTLSARSLYWVTVRTAAVPATAYVYPIRLQDTLPDI